MTNERSPDDINNLRQNPHPQNEDLLQPDHAPSPKTEVKNTHAAGDGAMGPNETPLPEINETDENEAPEDPPY